MFLGGKKPVGCHLCGTERMVGTDTVPVPWFSNKIGLSLVFGIEPFTFRQADAVLLNVMQCTLGGTHTMVVCTL